MIAIFVRSIFSLGGICLLLSFLLAVDAAFAVEKFSGLQEINSLAVPVAGAVKAIIGQGSLMAEDARLYRILS